MEFPPVFFEVHRGLEREAPGDEASTLRALRTLGPLPDAPRILDIGCGPGRSSLILARETQGTVVAVDLHEPFLDQLAASAREAGLSEHIRPVVHSMDALDSLAEDTPFDLLWGEGSIYIRGLEEGLRSWRDLLRPGGQAAFSHIAWLVEEPAPRARSFWEEAYPAIRHREANRETIREAGYDPVDDFALPASAWWDYYTPIEARLADLRAKYAGDAEALAVLDAEQGEIDLYRACGDSYGYVFYMMRRPLEDTSLPS